MNGMAKIDAKLLEALQQTTCFGIAYEDTNGECRQCDVKLQCRSKMAGNDEPTPKGKTIQPKSEVSDDKPKATVKKDKVDKPDTKPAKENKPKPSKPAKVEKVKQPDNPNMPNFSAMSWEQLVELAATHKLEWKDYGNVSINRMRLMMALKKLY